MRTRQFAGLVRQYGGSLHGACSEYTDVEFPSVLHGASFIDATGWADVAILRDPVASLTARVVIQIPNGAVASLHYSTR